MLAALLLASCATGRQAGSTRSTSAPGVRSPATASPGKTATTAPAGLSPRHPPAHIFVVVMENLSYASAMATPGFAALARRFAYLSSDYAVSHPSLPNYLGLVAGSTFGVTSDCLGCFVNADNLGTQMSAAGISWGAYMESVGQPCYLGTSFGDYAAKHNPFRYFTGIRNSTTACAHLLPYGALGPELAGPAAGVPRFVWVSPNVCNDGHSCPPALAAAWLTSFADTVVSSAAWRGGGELFVTWDEGDASDTRSMTSSGAVTPSGGGGHVLMLVVSPSVPAGTVIPAPLNHFGLLATIEKTLGLPYLGAARAWARHTLPLG
ncbi:MAG: hypothetical protein M0020_06005 [Actinomycetota bacterium]|nr:hypothetical protein [Actinomycetota bacterium]